MKFDYSSVLLTAINLLLFSVTSRSYDTAFDTFHQSSAGKIFADKLSYLQVYIGSLGSSTVHESKNETHQKNPDKIHERELEQLERYRSIHPKLVDIVPEIRRAIRSIYPEAMHAADVVQHESGKITGTIKKHSSKQEMTGMGSISPNAATSDEQVIDAIVLDNIRKILQSLKDSASPEQLQSILGDKRELAKRLLRGDMELDDEDFKKTHFGLDTEKIRTLKDAKLSATFLETLNNYLYVKPLSPKKKINYCHENNKVCDRRKNKDSCESRFHIGDQGNCGSCWAFAGVYHISLHHCLATGSDSLFSIQEIMDCSRAHCHGGFHGDVAMYLQRYNRIADERSYPYEYRRVYCRSYMKPNTWTGIYAKNLQHEILGIVTKSRLGYTDDQWKTLIKKLISLFGSVVHYLNGHQIRYEAGLRPVFLCDRSEYTNHAVLLTGWKVMNGVNVWILRNSWGESWGENGYAYIAMDSRCGPDSDPVIQLDLMEFDRWKDEVEDDVVIRTRSNNRSNNDLKTEKVQIGQTINLSCLKERKKIHINNFHVMKYGRVAEKQYCSNLKLDNSCENKRTCSLYFGYGLCDAGFNQLVVQYECIDSSHTPSPNPRPDSSPGPSPSPPHPRRNVDCNKVEALYPRIQPRSSCLRLCTAVSRMCSEINCFYRYIKKAYCNLDKIFLSTPEPAKKFNCSNAIATHENLFSTGECIKYCEGFLPYCETRECLATKVGKFYCDLSKI